MTYNHLLVSASLCLLVAACRTTAGNGSVVASDDLSGDRFVGTVQPTRSGDLWRFAYGPIVVEIDAAVGASIPTLSYQGSNVLAASSWFRPSPQNAWGWPPPAEIEALPFNTWVEGSVLNAQGQNNAHWGLQAKKRFWANAEHQVFTVEYTLTNTGTKAASWAPWEISRVHPTGLTFFPTGQATAAKASSQQLPLQEVGGISWFDYEQAALQPGKYIVARDGAEGWLAHVEAGLVFIKTFPDVPTTRIASDEGEIQLYTEAPAGADKFLEVEDEAAVAELQPGQSTVWTVHWYLRPLPPGLVVGVGSEALATFVRSGL